jgi:molybdopterin-guanine dinucleotide biosynthesis protein A
VQKLPFSAVILAGGDSKRMGTNKAFLKLEGRNLIDIVFEKLNGLFKEVIVVTDRLEEFSYLPARVTTDLIDGCRKNALRGIQAGLTLSSHSACFVIACDMPFPALPLINYMSRFAEDFDVVVPRIGSYYEPLFAFYNKTALETINRHLENNKLKIFDLYSGLCVKDIGEDTVRLFDPQALSFYNINTREDYLKAKKIYNPQKRVPC